MFHRILVPLDGSQLSGKAIPYAAEIARRFKARVILMRVVPPTPMPILGSTATPEVITITEKEALSQTRKHLTAARRYLKRKIQQLASQGLAVTEKVVAGAPLKSILDICREEDIDLIVMTTHGRKGLKRAIIGSISDEVIRECKIPVLVTKPE